MTRPTRNATLAIVIVAALVAFVPTMLALSNCLGLRGVHKDWFVYVDAASLVRHSESIVVARLMDETTFETSNSRYSHPDSPASFVDLHRRFEVIESLKGDHAPGDTVHVVWIVGHYPKSEGAAPELVSRPLLPFSLGETYVLFLDRNLGRRPPTLEPGIIDWKTPDGLGLARPDSDGRLSFETNAFYRAALKDMGLKPVDGSGAPFELTVEGIRQLVASGLSTDQP